MQYSQPETPVNNKKIYRNQDNDIDMYQVILVHPPLH